MSARTALPVLLLTLFAPPARADVAFPSDCDRKKEGDSCRDDYSRNKPGQCMHMKCVAGSYDGEGDVEDYQYDCFQCTANPQAVLSGREKAIRAQQAKEALSERIRWGLGALGAGCVVTAVWYDWRRRSKARGTGSASE